MAKRKPTQTHKRTSGLLQRSFKFGASRRQNLFVALGILVALGAGIGVYSQYAASHASTPVYGNWKYVGTNNSYGEDMVAFACQMGVPSGTSTNTVKAHFQVNHSRAGNHTYYGEIFNHDATTALTAPNYADSSKWTTGTTVSGFQALNAQLGFINANHNNYLSFYAGWGPGPGYNGKALIGSGFRPSALPYCT